MNKKELELYIHIPFCVRKCSYCDFLSAPATEQTREAYMAALFAEIGGRAKDYSDRTVTSIFIGGGTPSLLSGAQIGQLMDRIREQFAMAPVSRTIVYDQHFIFRCIFLSLTQGSHAFR